MALRPDCVKFSFEFFGYRLPSPAPSPAGSLPGERRKRETRLKYLRQIRDRDHRGDFVNRFVNATEKGSRVTHVRGGNQRSRGHRIAGDDDNGFRAG